MNFIDNIIRAADNVKAIELVLDYSKTFATLDHKIMLSKLYSK